jgi:protease-4
VDRQSGVPAGLSLPVSGIAAAEEPSGLGTTPAAAGFVGALALQWFREGLVTPGSRADGLYAADGVGPLGVGYAVEWVRPGEPGDRFRHNALTLSLGDRQSIALGVTWHRYWSADPAVAALASWDVGLTVRPWRHLSVAGAMLGRDARLGDARLPIRYDLGVATRLLRDSLTLSADLLADDRARDAFHATHVTFGAAAELTGGLALGLQIQVPVREVPGVSRDPSTVFALTWNEPHLGVTGGGAATPERTGWLVGVRSSAERYRGPTPRRRAPRIEVADELERKKFLVFETGDPDPYGGLLLRLGAVRADPEVAAVVLVIDDLPLGGGRVEELRAAMTRIKQQKPVLAYVRGGGTREYWLATAATAIATAPGATLDITGIGSSALFFRDAFARAGIAFEVVAAGSYKSAPEPLVRTEASPAAREATNALLDDVFGRIVADVAEARHLSADQVRALVDRGLFGAAEAKEAGLVDALVWPDELQAWASAVSGRRVRLGGSYEPEPTRAAERWGRPPVIEVVRVEGAIVAGKSRRAPVGDEALAGARTIAAQIRHAADDREVKAIVLRVDSPGGDGFASDLIWREVVRARERKPVIASMGDLAASGGYLAAAGADVIVAEPSTLTGSIGVFIVKPDLSGLLSKLSIGREGYARGQNAEIASVTRAWTVAERVAVEKQIDGFYRIFVARVAEGRRLSPDAVEAVAQGRVWTGRQALERGLVDVLGSLEDALAIASERAGLRGGAAIERADTRDGASPGPVLPFVMPAITVSVPEPAFARALSGIPELRLLSLLSEMGPVLALPLEWVVPGESRGVRGGPP